MNKPVLAATVATCVLATQVAFAQAYIGGAIGPSASGDNCGAVDNASRDAWHRLSNSIERAVPGDSDRDGR